MPSDRRLAARVRAPRVLNIDDLRTQARQRLPALVFDYIDGGAEGEVTLRQNCRVFDEVALRPRQCVPVPACDLRTTVLGTSLDLPFMLAPVGFSRMLYPQGEACAARAAHAAGTAYVLSTFSGMRLEDVRAATAGPLWFQLYVAGGRAAAEQTLARAKAAGYSVLVVTIDTPVSGMRERDVRHGVRPLLRGQLLNSLPHLGQFVVRPGWVFDYLRDGAPRVFPNVELPGIGPLPCGDVGTLLDRTFVAWHDLRWIRDTWQGPIVVKGVHTGDAARCAVDSGADAVVVSNHGGRQLDGVPGSLQMLPEVVAAVRGRVEVLMDGGIRRGSDVIKALALGARAVLIGRAYAWGLGAAGAPGVARAIEILQDDLVRTLRLLGCPRAGDIDASYIQPPAHWTTQPHGTSDRQKD
jgi:isopentenyl diphosphate isomerase/L-lactate dehydrogenase-like FMN-dependent dehydrogenase